MAFDRDSMNNVSSGSSSQMKIWTYKNTNDTLATIKAAGYFNDMRFALHQNDVIYIVGSDGSQQISITSTVNASSVTTTIYTDGGAPLDATYWVSSASSVLTNEVDVSNFSAATVATGDKIIGLDVDDSDNPKTFTAQSIADLASGSPPDGTTFVNSNYIMHLDITGVTTAAAPTADRLYYIPIVVGTSGTFTRIGVEVSNTYGASEVARLGIYSPGSDGKPGALVVDGGTVTIDSAGDREVTISQALQGKYYLAVVFESGSGTSDQLIAEGLVRFSGAISSVSVSDITMFYEDGVDPTASLPANAGTVTNVFTAPFKVWTRIA